VPSRDLKDAECFHALSREREVANVYMVASSEILDPELALAGAKSPMPLQDAAAAGAPSAALAANEALRTDPILRFDHDQEDQSAEFSWLYF
jgi:hypothetical protein